MDFSVNAIISYLYTIIAAIGFIALINSPLNTSNLDPVVLITTLGGLAGARAFRNTVLIERLEQKKLLGD